MRRHVRSFHPEALGKLGIESGYSSESECVYVGKDCDGASNETEDGDSMDDTSPVVDRNRVLIEEVEEGSSSNISSSSYSILNSLESGTSSNK